jgi:DNA-binding transcriptional LysR family regulator
MVVENIVGCQELHAETIHIDGLVETIKRRLMTGSGFAWMPETAIMDELAAEDLVVIGDEAWQTRLTIAALANPSSLSPMASDVWQDL